MPGKTHRTRIEEVRAQLEGAGKKAKKQTNVSIDAAVYERMNKYLEEKNVLKGEFVSACIDMFLEQVGY